MDWECHHGYELLGVVTNISSYYAVGEITTLPQPPTPSPAQPMMCGFVLIQVDYH